MRRIDILYFKGCPNHEPAVELARDIVSNLGMEMEVHEVEILGPEEAEEHRFLGSPSIRIDGIDVEPSARDRTDFGYSCRTYSGKGLPNRELLVAALGGHDPNIARTSSPPSTEDCCKPSDRPNAKWDRSTLGVSASGGSVLAAVVASACCWLPLSLVALGFSVGGIGGLFEATRPYFLVLAALLLSAGFYVVYVRKADCEPGSACEPPSRFSNLITRSMLWLSAVGVVAFAFFPQYVGDLRSEPLETSTQLDDTEVDSIEIGIDGMTCAGCTIAVEKAFMKIPGVLVAHADHESGIANLTVDVHSEIPDSTLLQAVVSAGFRGRILNAESKEREHTD